MISFKKAITSDFWCHCANCIQKHTPVWNGFISLHHFVFYVESKLKKKKSEGRIRPWIWLFLGAPVLCVYKHTRIQYEYILIYKMLVTWRCCVFHKAHARMCITVCLNVRAARNGDGQIWCMFLAKLMTLWRSRFGAIYFAGLISRIEGADECVWEVY